MVQELTLEKLSVSFVTSLVSCFVQFCVCSKTHLLCSYYFRILTFAIQKSAILLCVT